VSHSDCHFDNLPDEIIGEIIKNISYITMRSVNRQIKTIADKFNSYLPLSKPFLCTEKFIKKFFLTNPERMSYLNIETQKCVYFTRNCSCYWDTIYSVLNYNGDTAELTLRDIIEAFNFDAKNTYVGNISTALNRSVPTILAHYETLVTTGTYATIIGYKNIPYDRIVIDDKFFGPNYILFLLRQHPVGSNIDFLRNKFVATINAIMDSYSSDYLACMKHDLETAYEDITKIKQAVMSKDNYVVVNNQHDKFSNTVIKMSLITMFMLALASRPLFQRN
jgi:hypothetical protein